YPLTVMRALYYIRVNLCEAISIDDICRHVGMSKYYFCRMFKAYTGMPVIHYINMLRCDYAQKLIAEKGCNVTEAAQTLGIHNLPYFSRLYKRHTGVTPSKMKPERR
ncbi:MAG: AraC family transcriptional regulator, partial [Clostridia bacterium]|nr:AraC family transcriptional regulator [Clostridia bacterium]